jgi:N-acetylglucosamine kinase-like BadF-type ATPase
LILIIESGSSKTQWRILDYDGTCTDFTGPGFNIAQQAPEQLIIPSYILSRKDAILELYSFLAGLHFNHKTLWSKFAGQQFKSLINEQAYNDLMASCLATAGNIPGIVGILGTGSNACFYNGERIEEKAEPLGYILGDEGSGFHFGKILLNDYFNNRMPDSVLKAFEAKYSWTKSEVLDKVYRGENPKFFVASFAKFLNGRQDEYSFNTIKSALTLYLEKYIIPLYKKHPLPLYFTGSIADNFKNQLEECCSAYNMNIASIIGQPMNNLSLYFQNQTRTKL